jgi:hypothetical protein
MLAARMVAVLGMRALLLRLVLPPLAVGARCPPGLVPTYQQQPARVYIRC